LTDVDGYLQFYSNRDLTNLSGLSSLVSVGNHLTIYANPSLASITGVISPTTGKLTNLGNYLTVQSNSSLSLCQATALRAALAAGGWNRTFNQSGNQACNSPSTCVGTVCQ
jgi:hypothetical protein